MHRLSDRSTARVSNDAPAVDPPAITGPGNLDRSKTAAQIGDMSVRLAGDGHNGGSCAFQDARGYTTTEPHTSHEVASPLHHGTRWSEHRVRAYSPAYRERGERGGRRFRSFRALSQNRTRRRGRAPGIYQYRAPRAPAAGTRPASALGARVETRMLEGLVEGRRTSSMQGATL